jgi:hypothetical protein
MKYQGGCHCGAVKYEVEADLSSGVISCNCSHRHIKGLVLAFVPAENFTLLSGEDNLQEYFFNKKSIHHLFCKTCGVESFARGKRSDGTPTIAINVRCLEGVDLDQLTIKQVDGKSF